MSGHPQPARGGFLDYFALWLVLGSGLLLMPLGSLLVPALSIERAVLATVVAAVLASLLVAAITSLAARKEKSTLELLAEPFGDAGKPVVVLLLLVRHVLFAAFALVLITDAATLIGERSLGADLRPLWAALFAVAALVVIIGPQRSWKVWRAWALIAVLVSAGIGVSAYMEFEIPSYLTRPAVGGWPSFWQAVDVMVIFPLLWLPVAADYASSARSATSAGRGAFWGLLLTTALLGTLGIIYLPATGSGDLPGFLVGMELGLIAMAFLFVLQLDEVAVNTSAVHSTLEGLPLSVIRPFTGLSVLAAAFAAALLWRIAEVEPYLLLAGSLFVPGFAVVVSQSLRPARLAPVAATLAWAGGFFVYQWITPADIAWWRDFLDSLTGILALPFPLSDQVSWLGGAIASFVFAFAVHAVSAFAPALRPAHRPSAGPAQ